MPTFTDRPEPLPARAAALEPHPLPRLARLAAAMLVLTVAGAAAAQTCASSWADFRVEDPIFTSSTPWSDPTSIGHHSVQHASAANQRLASAVDDFDYLSEFHMVLRNTFGFEYAYLAETMGLKGPADAWMAVGISGLDAFVNFDDPIEIDADGSGTMCANLYAITDGSHEGEFLLVVRDSETSRIKHWEVVPNEDIGRARAHQVLRELNKVMLGPDGCGDMRVGPGC